MKASRIASALAALALGGAGLALAAIAPAVEVADAEPVRVDGTARSVSLACPPDFEKTMGAMTAGIGGEDSETLLRTRAIISGGGDAVLGSTDLGAGGLRTFFEAGAFPVSSPSNPARIRSSRLRRPSGPRSSASSPVSR